MATDRRSVLRAGLTAVGVTAVGVTAVSLTAGGDESAPVVPGHRRGDCALDLPKVDGSFATDETALAAASEDFGHIVTHKPAAVLKPGSVDDIATVSKWAAREHVKVAPRGQGHSTWGRSEVDGGVVIDMGTNKVIHSISGDRAVVDAGVKWSELVDATIAKGLTPPVLADYLELSVGGTIAVGGVGGSSYLYGMQTDIVLELEVVTGAGQVVTCSAAKNRDLFDAVRAGLGQVATITKATIKLIAAPKQVRHYALVYTDVPTYLADQRKLNSLRRTEYVQGAVLPDPAGGWKYTLDLGALWDDTAPDDAAVLKDLSDDRASAVISDVSYRDWLGRLAGLEALLRSTGEWFYPHPWLMTFVPDSKIQQIAGDLLNTLTAADLGKYGRVAIAPLNRSKVHTPLFQMPGEEVFWVCNVVRFPPDDATVAQQQADANRAIYDKVKAAGGKLYPVSALKMTSDDWRTHLGAAYGGLRNAKRKYDPANVLTPGYEVF